MFLKAVVVEAMDFFFILGSSALLISYKGLFGLFGAILQ